MSEQMNTASNGKLSYGEHAAEIEQCDCGIKDALTEAAKMHELHLKYDSAESVFYLRQVEQQCSRVLGWMMQREALIRKACNGSVKNIPLWMNGL